MIFINGSAEGMAIGEERAYLITNEIHHMNDFFKTGFIFAAVMGFIAFTYGFRSALSSHKKLGSLMKAKVIIRAILIGYDLYDDILFIIITQYENQLYLYLFLFVILIVPIYNLYDVM